MTPPAPSTTTPVHQVGDRVRVRRGPASHLGWISSVHRRGHGVEYVVRLADTDGGMGQVVNIRTTPGHCSLLTPAPIGGASR